MEHILFNGNTHAGRRRKENQDAWTARPLWSPEKVLLLVVDGVGGYAGGEKAAAIARSSIEQYMQSPSGDMLTMLREAVVFANNRIVEERMVDQLTSEMCCVLTAVVADEVAGRLYYVHVGDTRLYRFRHGKLFKITRDHSLVGLREDAGELSELEAMSHPQRHQIFREVGSAPRRLDDEDFLDFGIDELLPGDSLLLCSDGLTDMVTAQQISTLLSAEAPLEQKTDNLIALANQMGGHDNVTVVLLQWPASAIEEVDEEESLPAVVEEPAAVKSSSRRHLLLWTIAAVLLIAVGGLYFSFPRKPLESGSLPVPNPVTDEAVNPGNSAVLPGRRTTHAAVPGPPVVEQMDTLRISTTQSYDLIRHYADSTGKTLVLLPAKAGLSKIAAIVIDNRSARPGDTITMRNLRFRNFETGIQVAVPVVIKTDNLLFENIRYPFRYPLKADSSYAAVLFMNKTMH